MQLFTIQNHYPYISTEALLIPAFSNLWTRDKTKDKSVATKELAYVYFMSDYKSIYNNYPSDMKEEAVVKDLFAGKYSADKLVYEAIDKYQDLQDTFATRFLKSARGAAEKTMNYFDNIDYTEKDKKDNLVYKVKEVTQALKDCGSIIEALDKLVERSNKEQGLKESKQRGGGTGGFFEDK